VIAHCAHSITFMTLTSALTPYTCGLACLESYFSDIGRALDQCEILKKYPQYVTNPDASKFNEFGATSDTQLVDLCRHLGFMADRYEDFRQDVVDEWFDRWLTNKFCVLLYLGGHCVRLSQIISAGKYEVMNPKLGTVDLEEVTFNALVERNFSFIAIGL
jgi:hypothetical protein